MKMERAETPPPHGWMNEVAKVAGCSRMTVYLAIRKGAKGEKSEKVRQVYAKLYGGGEHIKIL